MCAGGLLTANAQDNFISRYIATNDSLERAINEDQELVERMRNMPNIEVGKGITFEPQNKLYKMTLRFRMQNMVAFHLDKDFSMNEVEARVFDGYIFSPKLLYSIQLGFTPYDAQDLPNGNTNIVRDAIVYYMPNNTWNIGFGQTKIKANRARVNSSSALQFVDRSIVNSTFNIDRDFGFFGEYNKLGRFKSLGDVAEGDFEREETVKLLLAGAFSYNDNTTRLHGQNGALTPDDATRDLKSYFVDFILKYQGFAFYTDFMGRACDKPLFESDKEAYVFTGNGLNLQTSYLFPKKWEIALRNSTLFPKKKVRELVGYKNYNQTTVAVTKYLIGHSLKVQADASYNHQNEALLPYNRWEFRFQVELGL